MRAAGLVLGLLTLQAGCTDSANPAPAPTDAGVTTLVLEIPVAAELVPRCRSPVARLYADGMMVPCSVLNATPRDGGVRSARIICSERKGLRSGVPYLLEAVYLQGRRVVARGAVSSERITLQPGSNQLIVPAASVTTHFDVDGNGKADLEDACP